MIGALTIRFTPAPPAFEHLEDAALVLLAKRGNDEAFDELVKRHAPKLHAVAKRIVGTEEAYDVVQDAFINAYRALPKFLGESQFTTWMHRITLNCCYARLRKHPDMGIDLELSLNARFAGVTPAEVSENRDLKAALEAALARINKDFRETFVLIEFGQLDYASAAEVVQVELGTVNSRMNRARAALRDILEGWGYRP